MLSPVGLPGRFADMVNRRRFSATFSEDAVEPTCASPACAVFLSKTGGPGAIDLLTAAAGDKDPEVGRGAVRYLALAAGEGAPSRLRALLSGSPPGRLPDVIVALGGCGANSGQGSRARKAAERAIAASKNKHGLKKARKILEKTGKKK